MKRIASMHPIIRELFMNLARVCFGIILFIALGFSSVNSQTITVTPNPIAFPTISIDSMYTMTVRVSGSGLSGTLLTITKPYGFSVTPSSIAVIGGAVDSAVSMVFSPTGGTDNYTYTGDLVAACGTVSRTVPVTATAILPPSSLVLQNGLKVDNRTYQFDIMFFRNSDVTFRLDTLRPVLTFNRLISYGDITATVNGSELTGSLEPEGDVVVTNNGAVATLALTGIVSDSLANPNAPGLLIPLSPGVKVGTVTLRSSTDFVPGSSLNLQWSNATSVKAYLGKCKCNHFWHIDITKAASLLNIINNVPLPVQLKTFAVVSAAPTAVSFKWETASEVHNFGFVVFRSSLPEGPYTRVSELVQGHGTTLAPQTYQWTDKVPNASETYYRLRQYDLDNTYHDYEPIQVDLAYTTGVSDRTNGPKVFQLAQNFPNPFNPTTVLQFSVEHTGPASLLAYNAIGQVVATLYNHSAEAGHAYQVRFDAGNLASGVYFCKLSSGGQEKMIRMALVK
jgi:hypothetical protein